MKEHPEDRKIRIEATRLAKSKCHRFSIENMRELVKLISTYADEDAETLLADLRERFWINL